MASTSIESLQIHLAGKQLPETLRIGFVQIENARSLALEQMFWWRKSDSALTLRMSARDLNPRIEGAFVVIYTYKLPAGEQTFFDEVKFFEQSRKKWVKMPEGMKWDPSMVSPPGIPSSWDHEGFPQGQRTIVQLYRSERLALMLRFCAYQQTLLSHPMFRDFCANLRIAENEWNEEPPDCR